MVAALAKAEVKAEREAALQSQGSLQDQVLPKGGPGNSSKSSAAEALKQVRHSAAVPFGL